MGFSTFTEWCIHRHLLIPERTPCRFTSCNKCTAHAEGAESRGGCACVGAAGVWQISAPSAQYGYELNNCSKKMELIKNKNKKPKRNPESISSPYPFLRPPAPGNHQPAFCLYGFACSGRFISMESRIVAFRVWLPSLSIVSSRFLRAIAGTLNVGAGVLQLGLIRKPRLRERSQGHAAGSPGILRLLVTRQAPMMPTEVFPFRFSRALLSTAPQ